jgi:uncharacterized protein YdaU (DUF1376 family)
MSLEAEGAYIRLLAYSWQDGSIPADIGQLSRMCKTSPKKMAVIWDCHLRECFEPLDGDPDKLVNSRLETVRRSQQEFRQAQSAAGSRGAAKRWQAQKASDGDPTNSPMAKNSSPSPSPVSSLQSSGGEGKPLATVVAGKVPKYTPAFELFWKDSTMRGSKQEAFTVWKKLAPGPELWGEIMSGMLNWMRSDQWQDETKQPHICRWLKRRGWEEIVPRGKAFFSELPSGDAYERAFEESQ